MATMVDLIMIRARRIDTFNIEIEYRVEQFSQRAHTDHDFRLRIHADGTTVDVFKPIGANVSLGSNGGYTYQVNDVLAAALLTHDNVAFWVSSNIYNGGR